MARDLEREVAGGAFATSRFGKAALSTNPEDANRIVAKIVWVRYLSSASATSQQQLRTCLKEDGENTARQTTRSAGVCLAAAVLAATHSQPLGMSQQTQLARLRPAVLAFTGLAAAYGAYVLYTSYAELQVPTKSVSQNGSLRRRGAIRRDHPSRPSIRIKVLPPDDESQLGYLLCRVEDRSVRYPVRLQSGPLIDEVLENLGRRLVDSDLQHKINVAKARAILQACSRLEAEYLRDHAVLRELCTLLASSDVAEISSDAPRMLSLLLLSPDERTGIDEALAMFLHSDFYQGTANSPELSSDAERDAVTIVSTEDVHGSYSSEGQPSQSLKRLLYHIARADANRKAYEHHGIACDECGEHPIRGIRWHCMNCPDWDLCSTCEANTHHPQTHVFNKIRIPFPALSKLPRSQPIWYTGEPQTLHEELGTNVRKLAEGMFGFETAQVDALYDQFCCFASINNRQESETQLGIDRPAFIKAIYPQVTEQQPLLRPNALYDRMFEFYDQDNHGVISFFNFLSGMAYLRGPLRHKSLIRAIQGYDFDNDGYVDRRDFIRLFRAKFEVQKLLINHMVECQEAQYTQDGINRLHSSQPISSIFADEDIPRGGPRPRTGKRLDQNGDLQPEPGTETILEDDEGWLSAAERRRARHEWRRPPHERFQGRLSAFGEVLSETDTPPPGEHQNGGDNVHNAESLNATNGDALKQDIDGSADEVPLDQDVLWEVMEEAFHEMLNPLFEKRERDEAAAIDSRGERAKWAVQIKNRISAIERNERELVEGAETDPLVATAMSAYNERPRPQRGQQEQNRDTLPAGTMVPVPTDAASLSERERVISQQPLDELLTASGYAVVDLEGGSSVPALNGHPVSGPQSSPEAALVNAEIHKDPTMPQNRPNNASSTGGVCFARSAMLNAHEVQREPETPPSQARLDVMIAHDRLEHEMHDRGGCGRLNYKEIEQLVADDHSGQLKGLITSWLEWASF